jgi:hypothetical protein
MADPPKPKSFEGLKSASDVTKQVIALSTGVITVTIAFFDKIQGDSPNGLVHWFIVGSWVTFVATIFFATWTLQGVTTSLHRLDQLENGEVKPLTRAKDGRKVGDKPAWSDKTPGAYDPMVKAPAALMLILFFVALALTAAAGIVRSSAPSAPPAAPPAKTVSH